MLTFKGYCKEIAAAEFYRSRPQLLELADIMQDFTENGKTGDVLNISMPARFGKSRIATDFSIWNLIHNKNRRILRASYSAELAENFSAQVRAGYSAFAESVLNVTPAINGTRARWSIGKNTQPNHIGTGVTGTITGFGCDIAIIDDTAKNMLEATSAAYRNQLNVFRETVLLSRLEGMSKIINVGTRWTVNDWFSMFPNAESYIIPALTNTGESCCEAWKTTAELQLIRDSVRDYVWDAQYMQTPTATGRVRLFEGWKPQHEAPPQDAPHTLIIDPATDFGKDYFVIGDYASKSGHLWLCDMLALQRMTIEQAATWINSRNYSLAYIEANGNGRNILNELKKHKVANLVGFATKTDKYSRAYLKADSIKNYFRISPECNPQAVSELVRQADEFPIGEHDDLIDDVVMAVEKLLD